MRRRAMQHHFPLEVETAFFEYAPGSHIDGSNEADHSLGKQVVARKGQSLLHQFRGIAASPAIGMQVIGKIEPLELLRDGHATEPDRPPFSLDRPASKSVHTPVRPVPRNAPGTLLR